MLNRGRVIVPSLHVSVAVADAWNCDSQAEMDKPDEAVSYNDEDWCTICPRVVGDHAYQTGETFKKSVPGKTKLYWYRPDGSVETYLCRSIDRNGINDPDSGLRTDDGTPEGLRWGGWTRENQGDMAFYTCNSTTGIPVTIIFWTRIA